MRAKRPCLKGEAPVYPSCGFRSSDTRPSATTHHDRPLSACYTEAGFREAGPLPHSQ